MKKLIYIILLFNLITTLAQAQSNVIDSRVSHHLIIYSKDRSDSLEIYVTNDDTIHVQGSGCVAWKIFPPLPSSGGGGSTDTTSLSNRINTKLNISDTTGMLIPYKNKVDTIYKNGSGDSLIFTINGRRHALVDNSGGSSIDTTSLSNRINLKLNSADTTSLSNRINLKLNISDTTAMLSPYASKTGVQTITNKTFGSGNTWQGNVLDTAYSNSVSDIGVTAPLTIATAGKKKFIAMPAASSGVNGYLTGSAFNSFASRLAPGDTVRPSAKIASKFYADSVSKANEFDPTLCFSYLSLRDSVHGCGSGLNINDHSYINLNSSTSQLTLSPSQLSADISNFYMNFESGGFALVSGTYGDGFFYLDNSGYSYWGDVAGDVNNTHAILNDGAKNFQFHADSINVIGAIKPITHTDSIIGDVVITSTGKLANAGKRNSGYRQPINRLVFTTGNAPDQTTLETLLGFAVDDYTLSNDTITFTNIHWRLNGSFNGDANIVSVELLCDSVDNDAFKQCFSLEYVSLPLCKVFGSTFGDDNVFQSVTTIKNAIFNPSLSSQYTGDGYPAPDKDIQGLYQYGAVGFSSNITPIDSSQDVIYGDIMIWISPGQFQTSASAPVKFPLRPISGRAYIATDGQIKTNADVPHGSFSYMAISDGSSGSAGGAAQLSSPLGGTSPSGFEFMNAGDPFMTGNNVFPGGYLTFQTDFNNSGYTGYAIVWLKYKIVNLYGN